MKNKLLILVLCSFLLVGLTGCSSEEETQKDNNIMVDALDIEEGCYSTNKDKEHLICFTKDAKYHRLLNKNNTYYNDPYYDKSYDSDKDKDYMTYEIDTGVLTMLYYSNSELFNSYVCSAGDTKSLNCTSIEVFAGQTSKEEVVFNKIEKDFNTEIIDKLPIYERNKEFKLDFNGNIMSCNLTRNYSIINFMASLEIKNCLEKQYNEEYTITQLDQSGNWQIYSKTQSEQANKNGGTEYLKNNFSYKVTVNDKSFKYTEAFPVDPYSTDDTITVVIRKAS